MSLGSNDRRRALTGQVVRVTTVGKEELYDVGIPTRSEAEFAVAKYLQPQTTCRLALWNGCRHRQ